MLDQTNHNRLAEQTNARIRAAAIADRYIPRTHNEPPAPIEDFDSLDDLERAAITAEAAGPDDEDFSQAPADPDKELKGAREAMAELKAWMESTPVIQTPAIAKLGADWKHRTSISLKAADEERDAKVRPHNDYVKEVNAAYKVVSNPLKALFDQLCKRLDGFRRAEEQKREAAAALIREAAETAARIAQEAEARVADAVDDASKGVEADVGGAIEQAQGAALEAARLARQATVADRDAHVRIPSSMGKAVSGRAYRELIVADLEAAVLAIRAMGLTERIADAICLEAKAFKAAWGDLPAGVTETSEKRI